MVAWLRRNVREGEKGLQIGRMLYVMVMSGVPSAGIEWSGSIHCERS
jgi:hypothetical protein